MGKHSGPALSQLICRYCEHRNPHTTTFCQRCRRPISPDAEKDIQDRKKQEVLAETKAMLAALGIGGSYAGGSIVSPGAVGRR